MSIGIGMGQRVVSLLEAEPISIDEEFDMVVLPAPAAIDEQMGQKEFYRTNTWPFAPVPNGEMLGVLGFPGELCRTKQFTLDTNPFYYENACAVSSRGASMLIGVFSSKPPVTAVHINRATKQVEDFDGISGAPIFALRDGKAMWVGVVKRGAAGRGVEAEIQITPSHFVQGNGTIRRR